MKPSRVAIDPDLWDTEATGRETEYLPKRKVKKWLRKKMQ
jgi:hypothetical protein